MKIPVLLEISKNQQLPLLYRACSRCPSLIGPYDASDPMEAAAITEITYCATCQSILTTKKNCKLVS